MKNKREVLVKLFLSTLYLSAFTFGGGYVIVTLMKKKFVDDYHWIEENEMLDLVAIAQSAPGPIAVNGAIVVGYKLAGLAGTLVAIIGTIIPPFVIISLISAFYHAFRDNYLVSQMLEGMQAGVGAVIASVTYEMGCGIIKKKDNVATIVMIAAFIAACVLGINVIYIVIASGVFGVIRTIWNRPEEKSMMYIQLFLSFFQISLFSFGGGYAALPLIQGQVVNVHHWLSMTEFTDLITISQMTPGPIAINAATFVGMKLTGMPGAVVATLGYITPSCIIVTIIAKLYLKYREMDMLQGILGGIRPAVVALIGSAGISILQTAFWGVSGKMVISDTSWLMVGIFVVCVILLRKVKMNPIWVMVLAGVMKVLVAVAGKI